MARPIVLSSYSRQYTYTLVVGTSEVPFTAIPSTVLLKNPEKIQVQAASTNTVAVLIGPTGITADYLNGGTEMLPGASTVLYFNLDESMKAIALAAGQKLLITYYSEPNG